jgi:hypothetical protein
MGLLVGLELGLCSPGAALAADPSKQECVAANESAQDLQRTGRLLDARVQLATCIATSCPAAVRQDCAQRLEEVTRIVPTVIFEAKDASGNDLGTVRVVMDGKRLVERLDGNAVQVDPGEHHFVFESDGFAPLEKLVVVRVAEKDRVVRVTLVPRPVEPPQKPAVTEPPLPVSPPPPPVLPPAPPPAAPPPSRGLPASAWASFGVGAAGLVAGGVLTVLWAQAKHDGDAACGVPGSCDATTGDGWESKQRNLSIGLAVGFGVAAVGAGVGLLLAPSHAPSAAQALPARLELHF